MKRLSIILVIILTLAGCNHTTKPKEGTISGSVILFDDAVTKMGFVDPSGVTVSLYSSVEYDSSLVRIIQDNPGLGIASTQAEEFDHRYYTPILQVTTDVTGAFRMDNVIEGTYNLVAEKDGWGWRYIYEVRINETHQLTLYPERVINGFTTDVITMLPDHHYVVTNNALVGGLSLDGDTWLRMQANRSLTVNGLIDRESEGYLFICADDLTQSMPASVNINGPNMYSLSNLVVRGISNGLRFSGAEVNLDNCRFDRCQSSLEFNESSASVSHSIFTGVNQIGQGIVVYQTPLELMNNIMLSFEIALSLRSGASGICEDNYIEAVNCLEVTTDSSANINHNELRSTYKCVETAGPQIIEFTYNNIYGNICFYLGSPVRSDQNHISNNNLITSNLFAFANRSNPLWVTYHFDFTNNYYYGINDASLIPTMIIDQNDETDPRFNRFYVDYLPVKLTRIVQAGIRNQ